MSASEVNLRDIGRLLWRRLPTLVLVFALTLGVGVLLALTHAKRYQSEAKVVMTPVLGKNLSFVPAQDSIQALINAYAETAHSAAVVGAAEAALGRPLHGSASSFTQAGDNSITISAEAASASVARADAAALLQAFQASITHSQFFTASLISPPSLPSVAIQPRPPLIIGSAALLGLVLGVLFATLIDYVKR